jgi:hypothetical protein
MISFLCRAIYVFSHYCDGVAVENGILRSVPGDMEADRKDRLKDKEIGDSTIGGAIIQQGIERDRREVVTIGLKSNG